MMATGGGASESITEISRVPIFSSVFSTGRQVQSTGKSFVETFPAQYHKTGSSAPSNINVASSRLFGLNSQCRNLENKEMAFNVGYVRE